KTVKTVKTVKTFNTVDTSGRCYVSASVTNTGDDRFYRWLAVTVRRRPGTSAVLTQRCFDIEKCGVAICLSRQQIVSVRVTITNRFKDLILSIVSTRLGRIRGFEEDGVTTFLGIRYGTPPVGARRFMPPQMAEGWQGVFAATDFPNRAMQDKTLSTLGLPVGGSISEDCLFLNLVTPSVRGESRPVLVWFHGGGFVAGSANEYDGSVLAAQGDVVVVTVNARLGVFGFLDLTYYGDVYAGSSSNGLRDLMLALRWIKENIEDYGGDPNNITVFGESSGGSSILSLLAAPEADDLFHKAIACSATAVYRPKTDRTKALSERLKCSRDDCLDVLLQMPAHDLLDLKVGGSICVDGAVVTRPTFQAIEERGSAGVPLLTGTTATEGTLYTKGNPEHQEHYSWLNKYLATDMLCGSDPAPYLDALRAHYPAASPGKIHEMVWTDMFRRICTTAAELSSAAGVGGWLYRFDLPANKPGSDHVGVPHASEMSLTFNTVAKPTSNAYTFHDVTDPVVQRVGRDWSNIVINMARSGTPNVGSGEAEGNTPVLPQYTPTDRHCLVIDEQFLVAKDLDAVHRRLWSAGA
ncbi:MAG TPA: hypothetical protein DER02_09740, partial [Gammaproteobacteria bacterium]|nr:hypothetical protein [Gammaproteobacteria bacterium]